MLTGKISDEPRSCIVTSCESKFFDTNALYNNQVVINKPGLKFNLTGESSCNTPFTMIKCTTPDDFYNTRRWIMWDSCIQWACVFMCLFLFKMCMYISDHYKFKYPSKDADIQNKSSV